MHLLALFAAAVVASPIPASLEGPAKPAPGAPAPLLSEDLEAVRGGEAQVVVLTEQNLSAVNASRIQANVVGSGAVNLNGAAFSNFDGVGNFVMNTGHLNNIQSSLSVTIVMTPPAGQ